MHRRRFLALFGGSAAAVAIPLNLRAARIGEVDAVEAPAESPTIEELISDRSPAEGSSYLYDNAKLVFLNEDPDREPRPKYRCLLLTADGGHHPRLKSGPAVFDPGHVHVSDVLAQNVEVSCRRQNMMCADSGVEFPSIEPGQVIGAAVVFKRGRSDAASPVMAFFRTPATPTNGGSVEILWGGSGFVDIAVPR